MKIVRYFAQFSYLSVNMINQMTVILIIILYLILVIYNSKLKKVCLELW